MTNEPVCRAVSEISFFCRLNLNQKLDLPVRKSELGTLFYLHDTQKEITPVAVSEFLGISRPCTTALLKRLESRGYISRKPSPVDGRSCTLSLTPCGVQLVIAAQKECSRTIDLLQKELGPERFRLFLELIEESNAALRKNLRLR